MNLKDRKRISRHSDEYIRFIQLVVNRRRRGGDEDGREGKRR